MEKLKMQSYDVIGSNTQKIAQLFPNCVTERLGKDGKPELAIDFEKLQAELSNEIITEGEERYQFTWPDKRAAVRLANTPTTMTLRPCREESVDFDNTQNLYIEGDNLDVLKVLRETYLGKVKMIYIDPPYNTGNDFVYYDEFDVNKNIEEERNGFWDEDGNQTLSNFERNTAANGRFHTDWLNMIYPRLKVARDLLMEDGVILISIDDCEQEHIKAICDEIYGSRNRISTFVWNCSTAGGIRPKHVSKTHEYIFVYAKNIDNIPILWAPLSEGAQKMYNEKDEKGIFRSKEFVFKNSSTNENQKYWITCPDGTKVKPRAGYIYRFVPETFEEAKTNNLVLFKKTTSSSSLVDENGLPAKWNIFIKKYFGDGLGCPSSLLPKDIISMYNKGTQDVQDLFDGNRVFENVKPESLVYYFTRVFTAKEDICLDFFSGSATTAHAVMKLNAEDGGNRKFIMVQLPEKTDEKSETYKAGYKNICEIGKERIRRAGKKVKEEVGSSVQNLDTGFRVLKLDTSNMEDVYYTPQEFELQSLFNENVKADRTNEDLLFQVMLDLGIELSVKIENKQIAGKNVHFVDDNYLVACFDRDVNESTITEIAKLQPIYFVMRDASAANDNVIDNFEQIFKHYSPDTNCRII